MTRRLRVRQAYDPQFHRTSSAYRVLGDEIRERAARWRDWPGVSEYDGWATALSRQAGRSLVFRDVSRARVVQCGGYDRFIHGTGQIPTRARSWHDFFNACIWSRFPRAKLAVHSAQLAEDQHRTGARRTRRQDWLTHFDECGVVLVSRRRELLDRVAALDWRRVFIDERSAFEGELQVYCFGHAILEALREPYVGLMGKAILCHDTGIAESDLACAVNAGMPQHELTWVDRWLEARLAGSELPRLHALPVLGVPGWHAANEQRHFYDQPRYFRTRPSEPVAPPGLVAASGARAGQLLGARPT